MVKYVSRIPLNRDADFRSTRIAAGGLRLDVRSAAFSGGDSGKVIHRGKPAESEMLRRVTSNDQSQRMPPEGKPLSPKEIDILRRWVAAGAKWPDRLAGESRLKSKHWAFQPPVRSDVPPVSHSAWCRNPIDRFVLARLESVKVAPSPEAARETLLRRLSLDLNGLPPTPAEIEQFQNDRRPDAFARLVERLLASPHFGERWGRHWLDLARYADSNGYERDDVRPNAWRYRDWVTAAVNRDLPYDQFVTQQLAGDLLPGATLEQKLATGFHRMTIKNTESGINKEDYRNREIVDRVNTTGTAILGISIGCAQCHSHKYDPFSQRDYYQLYAFFNNIRDVDLPLTDADDQKRYTVARARFDVRSRRLKARLRTIEQIAKSGIDKWYAATVAAKRSPGRELALLGETKELIAAVNANATARTARQRSLVEQFGASLKSRIDDMRKDIRTLSVEQRYLPKPYVMALAESTGKRRDTHVLLRGDFKQKGRRVDTRPPEVLAPFRPSRTTPDRRDLARWLVDANNPLTARVAVNRIWQHLFGRGLVATVDDFGAQGEKPTHPRLLDRLAVEFRESGWSRKHIIRLIVHSATYRQQSRFRPKLAAIDPLNELLARQKRFRVEGEIVRDSFLVAAGLLNRKVGGPTIRPPVSDSIRELSYKYPLVWPVSQRPARYRRGMYIHFKRTNPYPSLLMFDAPEGLVCTAKRNRSNTPLQALTTLNNPVFVECAQSLGRRILTEGARGARNRIRHAGRICLSRELNDREIRTLNSLFVAELQAYRNNPSAARQFVGRFAVRQADPAEQAAWTAVARTLMNLDEFLTRE
eukprot:g21446.t1